MTKRPQHRIIIPNEIWDYAAKVYNKIDPAEDIRGILWTWYEETQPSSRLVNTSEWSIQDWIDCMLENGYRGQKAHRDYVNKHYEVITGINPITGMSSHSPFRDKTREEIENHPGAKMIWAKVLEGFVLFMREQGKPIQ